MVSAEMLAILMFVAYAMGYHARCREEEREREGRRPEKKD
jgi:hypothetical protein